MSKGILSVIGHTPVIRLERLSEACGLSLFAKLEKFNPGGSIKDRPARRMLVKAMESGHLHRGDTVIESSSGNMAIGLAQACLYLALDLVVVVDPKINRHTLSILQAYGAEIDHIQENDTNGNYLSARLKRVHELLKLHPDSFWPNQYKNKNNPAAHYHTMHEIVESMPSLPDYLLVATSTCGTIMGCADYVQEHHLNTKIVAVDAVGSVIFGTPPAERLVPGHGAGRPSDLLRREAIDEVIHVDDWECVVGCRQLLQHEAILAGGSSGAVLSAVQKLARQIPSGSTCAMIFPDSGERYLETIFNDAWVKQQFGAKELTAGLFGIGETSSKNKVSAAMSSASSAASNVKMNGPSAVKIAIIGGGPKGTYGFERLAAQFKAHPPAVEVEVHVFNRSSHFGAGDVYDPGQPSYLLTNNAASEINMWIDEPPAAVTASACSLEEWRKEEQKRIFENGYISRATVGQYLEDGFQKIATHLPPGVRGKYYVGEVVDLQPEEDAYTISLRTKCGNLNCLDHQYDQVLLATGHPRHHTDEKRTEIKNAGTQSLTGIISSVYPVASALDDVPAGSQAGIKGMGLTFLDAVLALTEGRGGAFEVETEYEWPRYVASGREPKAIYPYSRSGLPMIPRMPAPKHENALKFFTEEALNITCPHSKIDFEQVLLPLIKQEMRYTFYRLKMRQCGFAVDLAQCETFAEMQHHINDFHQAFPEVSCFSPDEFLNPLAYRHPYPKGFHHYIQSYLAFFSREACKGTTRSPWAAVTAVWRKAIPLFGDYYAFGGLTKDAQQSFDQTYRRLLDRVTFGPPVESTEKLLGLAQAGILDFSLAYHPHVKAHGKDRTFVLQTKECQQVIDRLIDARIPKVSIEHSRSPLYQNMERQGLISGFKNGSSFQAYKPRGVAISKAGWVLDECGQPRPNLAATGTPTEGATYDNDTLSRNRNNFVSGWAKTIRKMYTSPVIESHAS